MRIHVLAAALASMTMTGPANAALIAGWDFSQYFSSGSLAVTAPTSEYSTFANYSDLDTATPVLGMGAGATGFGTMYHDGTNGSTDTSGIGAGFDWAPVTGELAANGDAPTLGTDMSVPGSILSLTSEPGSPQLFGNALRMAALSALDVVFQADLSGGLATDWQLSFGAQSSTGPLDIEVEFSTDGISYSAVQTFVVNTEDVFMTGLMNDLGGTGFFRVGGLQGFELDNVAINAAIVPEPSTALLLMVGIGGLAHASRQRR